MTPRALFAEAFGTFMLVSSILAAAIFGINAPQIGTGVALSVGFTVVALAISIGHVSGGHFNPAVTIGLVFAGRFDAAKAPGYIVAQCLGGMASGLVVLWLAWQRTKGNANMETFASNTYGDAVSIGGAFVTEALLTAFLVIVVVGATSRRAAAAMAPLAIGLTLAVIHLMSIPVTNTSVNPARSLGAALASLINGNGLPMRQLWLFVLAPVVGGLIGGAIGRWMQEE